MWHKMDSKQNSVNEDLANKPVETVPEGQDKSILSARA